MMSQRKYGRVGVVELFRAKPTDIGHTVDVMAEGTEAGVGNEVEREEAGEKESEEERDTDDEQNTFPKSVPLAKGDVRHKDYGSRKTEQQTA